VSDLYAKTEFAKRKDGLERTFVFRVSIHSITALSLEKLRSAELEARLGVAKRRSRPIHNAHKSR